MLPASSLRRSSMSAIDFGSSSRFWGSICITQISSGFTRGSSRTGGFWEKRPSQYTPPSVRTALNRVGRAVDARTVSEEIVSLRLLKALKSPERTFTAPIRSIGAGLSIGVLSPPKSTCLSSVLLSCSWAQKEVGVLYGLTDGRTIEPCSRFIQTVHSFNIQSKGLLAALSVQKESRSFVALSPAPLPSPW